MGAGDSAIHLIGDTSPLVLRLKALPYVEPSHFFPVLDAQRQGYDRYLGLDMLTRWHATIYCGRNTFNIPTPSHHIHPTSTPPLQGDKEEPLLKYSTDSQPLLQATPSHHSHLPPRTPIT